MIRWLLRFLAALGVLFLIMVAIGLLAICYPSVKRALSSYSKESIGINIEPTSKYGVYSIEIVNSNEFDILIGELQHSDLMSSAGAYGGWTVGVSTQAPSERVDRDYGYGGYRKARADCYSPITIPKHTSKSFDLDILGMRKVVRNGRNRTTDIPIDLNNSNLFLNVKLRFHAEEWMRCLEPYGKWHRNLWVGTNLMSCGVSASDFN